MDQQPLDELCDAAKIKDKDSIDVSSYRPAVNIFHIPQELLSVIPQLEKLKESTLFLAIWDHEVQAGNKLGESLDSVLDMWKKTKQKWEDLRKDIKSGTITFQNINNHINCFKDDNEKMRHEFLLMNDNDESSQWVEQRIEQLSTFSILINRQNAASVILKIQELFEFTGDFTPIKRILHLVCIQSTKE